MTLLKDKKFDMDLAPIGSDLIENAKKEIVSRSFPVRKTEDWRYAKLGKILNQEYRTDKIEVTDVGQFLIPDLEGDVIVLVNGYYDAKLSKINDRNGLIIMPLHEATSETTFKEYFNRLGSKNNEIFTSISTAYNQGGVYIKAERKAIQQAPVYIVNVTTGDSNIANVRNLIVAESFAELNVVQGYYALGEGTNFVNSTTEIFVGKNAKVVLDKIQNFNDTGKHICTEEVYQEADSSLQVNTYSINGGFIRNGLNIQVDGTNCHSEMNGLFLGSNEQFIDNHTRVDHLKSHCTSDELYKGILKDKSVGVFNGKVIVHPDAQVIEAFQQNNNVILSDDAVMNTKPELEIYADDVKCSHGTTTGQFDEEAIFYLQSRGINKNAAKELLIAAFADEVFDRQNNEAITAFIKSLI